MQIEELQERYAVLREFTQLIASGVNIDRISKAVVRQAAYHFSADVVLLFTLSSSEESIDIRSYYGLRPEDIPETFPFEDSVLDRALRLGGVLSVQNLEHQTDDPLRFLLGFGIRTVHISTLEGKERNLGALLLGMRSEHQLEERESGILEGFTQGTTAAVSAALSQEKLATYASKLEELVQKRTEDLANQKLIAEESNRAKGRFVANMSHELRTPLTAIVGYSSVVGSGVFGPINDKQKDALISIQRSSEHLKELIDEVLNLSRIEAGKEESEPSKVELFSLLQQIQKLMLQTAVGKGIELKAIQISEGDKLKKLWVDPRHIRQILLNIVSNAIKYTPSGGNVQLAATVSGDMARITVTDTGVGIGPEEASRLFNRFERGDDSYSREQTGTGLGLSLTKILTERNGGRIGADSEKGVGSTFWVVIPLAEDSNAVAIKIEDKEEKITQSLDGLNLLVVDDNPSTCAVYEQILSIAGATIHIANSVKEAKPHLERGDIDLCIVDLAIPGESGLTLIEKVRKGDLGMKGIPLLVVSACVFNEDQEHAMLAGADAFLPKPFNPFDLVERVRGLAIETALASGSRLPVSGLRAPNKLVMVDGGEG